MRRPNHGCASAATTKTSPEPPETLAPQFDYWAPKSRISAAFTLTKAPKSGSWALMEGVTMTNRKRRSARSGRPPLLSPGRPPVAGRDEQRRFWAAIASGMASEDAAVAAGVPQAIGTRWFRKGGGIPHAIFGR